MNKLLKIFLWTIGSLALVLVAVVVVIPMVVDPNDYRELIVTNVKEQTGRELHIDNKLSLSLFPWVGLETGGVSLGNAEGFGDKPMARIDRLVVRVKIWPLLSKRLEVGKLELEGLQLHLARNAAGQGNWEGLVKDSAEADPDPVQPHDEDGPSLVELSVGGVEVKSGYLEWDDRSTGQQLRVEQLNFVTGAIEQGQPVDFDLGFAIATQAPQMEGQLQMKARAVFDMAGQQVALENLHLTIDASGEAVQGGSLHLELDTDANLSGATQQLEISALTLSAKLDSTQLKAVLQLAASLKLDGLADTLVMETLKLEGDVSGGPLGEETLKLLLHAALEMQPKAGGLQLSQMNLDVGGIHISGAVDVSEMHQSPRFAGNLDLAGFNARQWAGQHHLELPPMADETTLGNIAATLAFKGGLGAKQANPAGDQILTLRLEPLEVTLDDSRLSGFVLLEGDHKAFDLRLDRIDADRYLPPETQAPLAETPPTDADEELIPVELLRSLDVEGKLEIGELRIKKLLMKEHKLELKAAEGRLRLAPEVGALYQGSLSAELKLDVSGETPQIQVRHQLQGVQIGPLLKDLSGDDRLLGNGGMNADITTSGNSLAAFKQGLNGTLDFAFRDGAVNGFNLAQVIRSTRAAFTGEAAATGDLPQRTDFSELGGSAVIVNGLVTNKDFLAKSPFIRVTGDGRVNLVSEGLDYTVTATIVNSLKGQGGEDLDQLVGVPIPVRVIGSFSKPDYEIDWAKILVGSQKEKLKQQAADKLEKKLQEKFNIPGAGGLLKNLF